MARLGPPPTPEECGELARLQELHRVEVLQFASLKMSILEHADLLGQTRSRISRMLWQNVGLKMRVKDSIMGIEPRDAANEEMFDDDSERFVNFISEFLKGVLEEEPEPDNYAAKLAHQVQGTVPELPNVEATQAWESPIRQGAVREGSGGATSGPVGLDRVNFPRQPCAPYLPMESSFHSKPESQASGSGRSFHEEDRQLWGHVTMVPQSNGSARIPQTSMTPHAELQQTQPSSSPTRMPQMDVEADVKSTSTKFGSKRLQNTGTTMLAAVALPVGRVYTPTSPLPVEVKPEIRSQGKQSGKAKKQNVATPLPVGQVFPPTSVASAVSLPVGPVSPAQELPVASAAFPVAVDSDSGSTSNASGDGPAPEHPGTSIAAITGNQNITTLVIRQVPDLVFQSHLLQMWPVTQYAYDMLYSPLNQRKRRSMGFAFMNFTSHSALLEFHRVWNGAVLDHEPGSKGLIMSAADEQGLEANIQRLILSKTLKTIKRTRDLPMIIEADGNVANFRRLMRDRGEDGGSQTVESGQEEGGFQSSESAQEARVEVNKPPRSL